MARVNLMKTPAAMMMGGPMFGGNETALGAMMANELMLTLIVATSILSILTVIRHTRTEEESGAAELVLSSVVGRYASTYRRADTRRRSQRDTGRHDDGGHVRDRLRLRRHRGDVPWRHRGGHGVRCGRRRHRPAVASGAHRDRRGDGDAGGGRACAWRRRRHQQLRQRAELVLPHRMGSADARVRRPAVVAVRAAGRARARVDGARPTVLESRRQYDDGNIPSSGEHPNARPIKSVSACTSRCSAARPSDGLSDCSWAAWHLAR